MALLDGFSNSPSSARYAYYADCREAILSGAAPIYRGEPGYRAPLDADNDGIACEAYRGP